MDPHARLADVLATSRRTRARSARLRATVRETRTNAELAIGRSERLRTNLGGRPEAADASSLCDTSASAAWSESTAADCDPERPAMQVQRTEAVTL